MAGFFGLFDFTKEGKGVTKEEAYKEDFSFVGFFKLFKRRFSKICMGGSLFLLFNFPIIFILLGNYPSFKNAFITPANALYQVVDAIGGYISPDNPALINSNILYGTQTIQYSPTTLSTVLVAMGLLVIFTYGLSSAASFYLLRNHIKGNEVFLFSDSIRAIKKNWKQALPLGIIDLILTVVLAFDVMLFYNGSTGDSMITVMLFICLMLAFIYFLMHFYMYIQLVTFDLTIIKIIKNSFIFAIIGFKRNILAFLGILALWYLNYILYVFMPGVGILIAVLFSVGATIYMQAYAAYPVIKRIMIDPIIAEQGEKDQDKEDTEPPIFEDRG